MISTLWPNKQRVKSPDDEDACNEAMRALLIQRKCCSGGREGRVAGGMWGTHHIFVHSYVRLISTSFKRVTRHFLRDASDAVALDTASLSTCGQALAWLELFLLIKFENIAAVVI